MKLTVTVLLAVVVVAAAMSTPRTLSDSIIDMVTFIQKYETKSKDVFYNEIEAIWNHDVDITKEHEKISEEQGEIASKFWKDSVKEANTFDWKKLKNIDLDLYRRFKSFEVLGVGVLGDTERKELSSIMTRMEVKYSRAYAVINGKHMTLAGKDGLMDLMSKSSNYTLLTEAFEKWRQVSGRVMKPDYERMVVLLNKAAKLNGYEDEGDMWRQRYEVPDFKQQVEDLYQEIRPLFEQLHAYARRQLMQKYSNDTDKFPESGHIPSHIMGTMWGSSWNSIIPIMLPFKNGLKMDVTTKMVEQNYTQKKMFKLAETFFVSIGLPKMVPTFWEKSMLKQPEGKEVICHPSAWDFLNHDDFRIKFCTQVNMGDLLTAHHEMGHTQYQMAYAHQPMAFRDGANNGFHEAIGDTMAMSVNTPAHLYKIKLLDEVDNSRETDLNFLMNVALDKIAFLPFAMVIDRYRWDVFDGTTEPRDYAKHWWDLRCKYQGIYPPVSRDSNDNDASSKYHVSANVAYIRYFISNILQFQFQEALCKAAGHVGPLYKCDIGGSKAAGKLLHNMLSMGASKPWPEAMFAITGQRKMSAKPILEYFKPLQEWLAEQNKDEKVTWDDACPSGTFADPYYVPKPVTEAPTSDPNGVAAIVANAVSVALLVCAAVFL